MPPRSAPEMLDSIDTTLKAILKALQAQAPKEIASDAELDSKYGDPEVKFTPRDWQGEPLKGLTMSQCPPEALDLLANTFDYFAEKAEASGELYNGKPTAPYKRKDAARARGWARRIRSGWVPPEESDATPEGWSDTDTEKELGF